MMMLDVLSQLPEIQVCVAYELNGKRIDNFPSHVDDLRSVRPVYETLPGRHHQARIDRYEAVHSRGASQRLRGRPLSRSWRSPQRGNPGMRSGILREHLGQRRYRRPLDCGKADRIKRHRKRRRIHGTRVASRHIG